MIVAGIVGVYLMRPTDTPTAASAAQASPPGVSPTGGSYRSIEVELTAPPGAEVHYTLDGSIPTLASERYDGPIRISRSTTLTAVTFRSDQDPSEPTIEEYVIDRQPVLEPSSGSFEGLVTVSIEPADGTVAYTLDGSTPDFTSERYTEPLLLQADTELQAATIDGDQLTPITVGTYEVLPAPEPVADGLVAEYRFGTGDEGRIVNLAGGSPLLVRQGQGTADAIDQFGGGLRLTDGATVAGERGFVELYDVEPTSFTLELWLDVDSLDGAGVIAGITAWQNPELGLNNVAVRQVADDLTISIRTEATDNAGRPLWVVPDVLTGGIQHLVLVRRTSGLTELWVDGELNASQDAPGSFTNWAALPVTFGGLHAGGEFWAGEFYSAAFYGQALDSAQVVANYQAGPGAQRAAGTVVDEDESAGVGEDEVVDDGTVDGEAEPGETDSPG